MKKLIKKSNEEKKKKKQINRNFIKFKLWFKIFKYKLLIDFIIFGVSFTLAIFLNKFFETLFVFISFFLFRYLFPKQLHLKSTINCVKLTLFIFAIAIIFILPKELSRLFPIIFGILICALTYFIQDYLDFKIRNKKGLKRGISEEQLKEICKDKYINEQEFIILKLYYSDCKKLWEIANELNYSEFNISRIKKKALDKLV